MYNVSDAYQAAIYETPICSKVNGTITLKDGNSIEVNESNIVSGSLSIKNQCVSKEELEIGCAYVGELNIAIYNDIDRNKLYDARIVLTYSLQVASGAWEDVPLGIFTITEATRAAKSVTIIAYDNMYILDQSYDNVQTAGYPYEILTYIATVTGITLAQSEDEIEGLVNGTRYFTIAPTAGYNTYRDIISDIAAMMCSFATVTRTGELKFVSYSTSITGTLPASIRNNSSIAEKVIHYDGIRMTLNGLVHTVLAEGVETSTSVLDLDTNPLIAQNNGAAYIAATLQAIANEIAEISYTPCTCNTVGNPAFDLGDLFHVTTGTTSECNMLLMSVTWKYHGSMQIKSVGKTDVRGKSKTEKQVSSISSAVASQDLVIHIYENASEYNLNTDWRQIVRIDYVSQKEAKGMFHAQILTTVTCDDTTAELRFRYVINNVVESTWSPAQTVASGSHIVTLFYPLTIPENTANSIRLQANITGGTANIVPMGIRATVDAQGIVSGTIEWDGTIEIEEVLNTIQLSGITVQPLGESLTAAVDDPTGCVFGEVLSAIALSGITIGTIKESVEGGIDVKVTRAIVEFATVGNEYLETVDGQIVMQDSYTYTSLPIEIDSGNACAVEIMTSDKAAVESVVIE